MGLGANRTPKFVARKTGRKYIGSQVTEEQM